mmetsp:Transcript_4989/g.10759  ORF Transcript_4989/g.10759 Transcript_4989/m.10759 type:complete len:435 (-) Transcript_4989:44-1348(-)
MAMMVDLPPPLAPTRASLLPGLRSRSMPCRTGTSGREGYVNHTAHSCRCAPCASPSPDAAGSWGSGAAAAAAGAPEPGTTTPLLPLLPAVVPGACCSPLRCLMSMAGSRSSSSNTRAEAPRACTTCATTAASVAAEEPTYSAYSMKADSSPTDMRPSITCRLPYHSTPSRLLMPNAVMKAVKAPPATAALRPQCRERPAAQLYRSHAVPSWAKDRTVLTDEKHSSATVEAVALHDSCSRVYLRASEAYSLSASSPPGSTPSVRAVSLQLVAAMRPAPSSRVTRERSAMLTLLVAASFISRVSSASLFMSSPVRWQSKNATSWCMMEEKRRQRRRYIMRSEAPVNNQLRMPCSIAPPSSTDRPSSSSSRAFRLAPALSSVWAASMQVSISWEDTCGRTSMAADPRNRRSVARVKMHASSRASLKRRITLAAFALG